MNNTLNNFIFILSILFLTTSCSDFGDLNEDPNQATAVPTSTLLTSSLRSISDVIGGDMGILYAQMLSETQFTEASRYAEGHFDFNPWYTGPLANLEEIIRLNTNENTKESVAFSGSNNNQIAVARILKAYFYHAMTDRWGPIPYSEALQGTANFKPKYDSQEFIYHDLFAELSEAVEQMEETEKAVQGDFLFDGDMQRWKQFANTLHLVMALRLSEVNATKGAIEFNKALTASGGVLASVEDNIMYPYLAEVDNQNPWFKRFETRTDFAISEPLVSHMKATNDPRLAHFADPAEMNNELVGMPYGIAGATAIQNAEVSLPHSMYVRAKDMPLAIFSYAQVLFSMAEAAHRGWINEEARVLYNEAIVASMAQWKVEGGAFPNNNGVRWNSDQALQLIGEQKWVALYMQGDEAWAEWRRLGYPVLRPAPDALNISGEIPRRQAYPLSEQEWNATNYQAAMGLLGGTDEMDTRLWWDVE